MKTIIKALVLIFIATVFHSCEVDMQLTGRYYINNQTDQTIEVYTRALYPIPVMDLDNEFTIHPNENVEITIFTDVTNDRRGFKRDGKVESFSESVARLARMEVKIIYADKKEVTYTYDGTKPITEDNPAYLHNYKPKIVNSHNAEFTFEIEE